MADPLFQNEPTATPVDRHSLRPRANTALSLVAGNLTDRIAKIWQRHRIHDYLLAPDKRRQVWHRWLSSQLDIAHPEQAYHFLAQVRSKDILADVYGCCPSGLISALGKFGARATRTEFYACLHGLLAKGGPLARHVHHLKQISDKTIVALAAINDHPPSDRILKILLKRSKPHQFAELAWIVGRLIPLLGEERS
jgi:hypothetical protein